MWDLEEFATAAGNLLRISNSSLIALLSTLFVLHFILDSLKQLYDIWSTPKNKSFDFHLPRIICSPCVCVHVCV